MGKLGAKVFDIKDFGAFENEIAMAIELQVPKIYVTSESCDALFKLWQVINQLPNHDLDITLKFQKCSFLSHIGVAFLGGLAHHVEHRGGKLKFDWDNLRADIYMNLAQNGFLHRFGSGQTPWEGNSIPYRRDKQQDRDALMDYLLNKWLGRGWVNISPRLQYAISGTVWELYTNAFEHGQSPIGVFTCGQRYPKQKELHLTIVDFGKGIPTNVRSLSQNLTLDSAQSLEWAFRAGNSSVQNEVSRGMGLSLLQSFITRNSGTLKVFSNDGYVKIKDNKVKYEKRTINFGGTLINIAFKCDESHYCLASEIQDTHRQWF
jgi:anti-sigma regulatory factor (Ser/Thr protein kinase)